MLINVAHSRAAQVAATSRMVLARPACDCRARVNATIVAPSSVWESGEEIPQLGFVQLVRFSRMKGHIGLQ